MSPKVATIVIVLLAIIIVVLAWFLWITPASAPTTSTLHPVATTTSTNSGGTQPTTSAPLDTKVTVTTPKQNANVAHTFNVTGKAPGPWYFEAVFPIQVRDNNDNIVGRAQGKAQGDWMTDALVPFTASITIDANFSGPATLILLKDNPSGMPENDDSVTIPITVQ